MRICEITGGIVTNVIDLPEGYVIAPDRKSASGKASYQVQGPDGSDLVEYDASFAATEGAILVASLAAQPGWSWSDTEGFIEPEPELESPVLTAITQRQLRLTLNAHGLLGQVEPAIAALPEPERTEASIEWQFASEFRRDHPLIVQIGAALELAPATIDAMWREAMAR